MRTLSIMDHSGHSTVAFGDDNKASVAAAMAKFEELVGRQKFTAATRKAGESDYRVIRSFNEAEDETLLRPQRQGG